MRSMSSSQVAANTRLQHQTTNLTSHAKNNHQATQRPYSQTCYIPPTCSSTTPHSISSPPNSQPLAARNCCPRLRPRTLVGFGRALVGPALLARCRAWAGNVHVSHVRRYLFFAAASTRCGSPGELVSCGDWLRRMSHRERMGMDEIMRRWKRV